MWGLAIKFLLGAGRFIGGLFTGGNLDSLLKTIDRGMDNEVQKEQVKAEVTKEWIKAQAGLLTGRTWWFQLFFVLPLGVYWSSLLWVCAFPHWGWTVHALPSPYYEWAAAIISALFIVDGSKAVLSRVIGTKK